MTFRTFLSDSTFFFTLYHPGKLNIILHLVSFYFCSRDSGEAERMLRM